MRKNYLSGLQNDATVKDALNLYVAPEGKVVNSGESGERFDLNGTLKAFLESDKKVFLLLGEAGSGKSTFNRYLARDLWESYELEDRKEDERIPVFIPLTTLEDPNKNLLTEYFTEEGFSIEQIQQLRQKRRFIFILDGYDEIKHRQRAFYTDNKLDKWDAKVVISSRPEYLGPSYQSKFYPSGQVKVFEECELAPFSKAAIRGYVESHVKHAQVSNWNAAQYQSALSHPDLQALIGNPFLLKIVLDVLPSLDSKEGSSNRNSYTRGALYEQFAKNWFARSQSRLQGIQLTEEEQKTFNRLAEEDFIKHGIHFSQEFALALYEKQVLVATYLTEKASEGQEWGAFLSNGDEKTRLLRFNAPLSRQGDQYRFIHKSIRDYFVARALWGGTEKGIERGQLLNQLPLVKDAAVLQFLSERVRQESEFKAALLSVIECSKEDGDFGVGASNAITVLVRAGVSFKGTDLKGVQISGADLSFGMFDSAQFEGADLRNANLRRIWLREANLRGAQMSGVKFGELPYLQERSEVLSCAYSPDGKSYAAGLASGEISVYTTSNWEKIYTLAGHSASVLSVVYSPSGAQLASGSYDNTIRVWDAASGTAGLTLEGHTDGVLSVVYSLSGAQIASGSLDSTVRLWDAQTGDCQILIQDSGPVRSHAWKETFGVDYLGIGSTDKSVRQWELKKEEGEYKAHLSWGTGQNFLTVRGALMEGVVGLSEMNQRLLKQREAELA
ncbi:NACHT domain-containing protein [Mycoavidus cysteinexigens]|nr:pentapeptide repeat-containing protein [Mycoavidus cysteinexigens]GAM51699.1 hypothetical protein EBME_0162 [bacterium endosymbiont of Mortierella elongata FMR23-6]